MRPWLIWLTGVVVYGAAILHRTTLGVAAPVAADQFSTTASVIALFVVLQVGMYSVMQVPAGVLLDRFGSRIMLTVGAAVMALTEARLNVGDFSDLRGVLVDVKNDPRDIQTLGNLAGKVDRIEALMDEHKVLNDAIETAIKELNGY